MGSFKNARLEVAAVVSDRKVRLTSTTEDGFTAAVLTLAPDVARALAADLLAAAQAIEPEYPDPEKNG